MSCHYGSSVWRPFFPPDYLKYINYPFQFICHMHFWYASRIEVIDEKVDHMGSGADGKCSRSSECVFLVSIDPFCCTVWAPLLWVTIPSSCPCISVLSTRSWSGYIASPAFMHSLIYVCAYVCVYMICNIYHIQISCKYVCILYLKPQTVIYRPLAVYCWVFYIYLLCSLQSFCISLSKSSYFFLSMTST